MKIDDLLDYDDDFTIEVQRDPVVQAENALREFRNSIIRQYPPVKTLEQLRHEHTISVLKVTKWNRTHAAVLLGISLRTLRTMLKEIPKELKEGA